jgi:hypothetical protein
MAVHFFIKTKDNVMNRKHIFFIFLCLLAFSTQAQQIQTSFSPSALEGTFSGKVIPR